MPAARRVPLAAAAILAIVAAATIAGCDDRSESEADPAPRPFGEAGDLPGASAPGPREQAQAIAGNPRLLLFDLQTAIESVRETRGAYPSRDEFGATDSWALQRAALDAAFDAWSYESDGATYRLTGEAEGREFGIHSPQ